MSPRLNQLAVLQEQDPVRPTHGREAVRDVDRRSPLGQRLKALEELELRLRETGQVPEVFKALDAWTGRWYQIYIAAAYGSEIAVGVGLLSGTVVSSWVCILTIGVGLAGFLSVLPAFSRLPVLSAVFDVPIVVHVTPAIIGVALLVR
jgi:hypothetical protein